MNEYPTGSRRVFFDSAQRAIAVLAVSALTVTALASGAPSWTTAAIVIVQALVLWRALTGAAPRAAPIRHGAIARDRETVRAILASGSNAVHGARSAALVVRLDDETRLARRHGTRFMTALNDALARRMATILREDDAFCLLPGSGFGIAIHPQLGLDIGRVLRIAQRLQEALAHSFSFEGNTVWPSVSVGFSVSERAAALNGLDMLEAAERAAERALQAGPNGLNSYSVVDFPAALTTETTATLRKALENGEIRAYFQPQIRTDTGAISGMEALARWMHPQKGLIPPGEFLPQIEATGLTQKLADTMLRQSLETLVDLDRQGLHVPSVSVNLSAEELRNPQLADEFAWALDKYDISPERLTIEILETVVANHDDDAAVHTIARLAGLGCNIDLDDFGTGHASIANIRRFAVGRIKIDRSFVTRVDEDPDQKRMVAAILSMAKHLGLATLAEGVECAGEQVTLAQMGCGHLQGFAIARPMPAADLPGWIHTHDAALAAGEPSIEDARPDVLRDAANPG